jgi:RimJ/RimL family protein N-acetyltransferase
LNIYIRPLREEDALKSWRWRNDAEVWALTGTKPDRDITETIELEWIRKALNNPKARRFAICISETNEYVGNVQLTNITHDTAQFHIFIGNKSFWGKGVASRATGLLLDWVRKELKIQSIHLEVNSENEAAICVYKRNGFVVVGDESSTTLRMEILLPKG